MMSDPLTARANDRLAKIWRHHRDCNPFTCDQRFLMENYGLLKPTEPAVLVTADGGIRVAERD